tara:strand:+ start:5184 stop:6887 length:1704 start_codon:yes stop_codon:yes gene_type:complete
MTEFTIDHKRKKVYTKALGRALFSKPRWNKDSAFTSDERATFQLQGLMPQKIETLSEQIQKTYQQYQNFDTDISKNIFLNALHDRNETLFYNLVVKYLSEMLPIIYTPTIGDAVKSFSKQYRRNRGIYLNYSQLDEIPKIISDHITSEIKMVIITDGEGVLGIGDWGIGGMDIAIGKLMVYIAISNINPSTVLPICLDVGTNNPDLINDPHYMGAKSPRIREEAYFSFVDVVINNLKAVNPDLFIHFEDFGRTNARRILNRYNEQHCTFNDDIQGTGLITLATIMSASQKTGRPFKDQTFVILGPGSAGLGIADTLKQALMFEGLSEKQAIEKIFLVGKYGLISAKHNIKYPDQKIYARTESKYNQSHSFSLLETIENVKPSVLIGCSGAFGAFNEQIIKTMYAYEKRPIIMPLSNPISCCEVMPEDAIKWTNGHVLIATGSPFKDVNYNDTIYNIAQCNNAYIFPGLGQGIIISAAKRLTPQMLLTASQTLSKVWNDIKHTHNSDDLLPPINEHYQAISYEIAKAVALQAIKDNVSDLKPDDLEAQFKSISWDFDYYHFSSMLPKE